MASRSGATVEGTDGNDYLHRETVVQQYHVSAKNKAHLKRLIFFHFLLSIIMVFIPKPKPWEWIWMTSLPASTAAWSAACRKSQILYINIFRILIIVTGLLPLMVGMSYHFSDLSKVITENSDQIIPKWLGIPAAVLWYVFFFAAFLMHGFQLYFAKQLVIAWTPKKSN